MSNPHDRQRFIDECLLRQFAISPNQSSRFLVERAAAFWDDREAERLRYEERLAAEQQEQPPLAKARPPQTEKAKSA